MACQYIPLSQLPSQTLHVVLDDQNCTISLYWRQIKLYLDLSVGSSVICQGCICQNCASIVQASTTEFTGSLHFFDMEGDASPQWEGLYNGTSGRWRLVYVPEGDEVPAGLEH